MKLIRCQNGFIGKKNGVCGRIIGILTEKQIDSLRDDPEGGPIFRCPACPEEERWMRVFHNGKGLVLEVIEKPSDFPDEVKWDEVKVFNQIG
jgi:hypothetical protein